MAPKPPHLLRVALMAAISITLPFHLVSAADPPGGETPDAIQGERSDAPANGLKGFFRSIFKGGSDSQVSEEAPASTEPKPEPKPASPARETKARVSAAPTPPVPQAADNPSGISSRVDKFVVIEEGAKFYRDGPLQIRPPDRRLGKGAIVQLVNERRGWSDVVLESGDFGTIGTDSLRKAKASDFPVEEIVVTPADGTDSVASVSRGKTLDDVPVVPLAAPDLPTQGEIDDLEQFASPLLLPPLPE
ncbi:hypothetical protein BH23VER1_BH23VER1_33520 [soil metagenome]